MLLEIERETIQNWIVNPASQSTENLASKSHETKRIPDPYIFLLKNNKLVSPSNFKPIEDNIDQRNYIEQIEYLAFLKIQDLVAKNNEGTIFWFSPPSADGYSVLKIVASTIFISQDEHKGIFNRAIVLDVDSKTSLEIADQISETEFLDIEELRANPILINKLDSAMWLAILSRYTNQIEMIKSGQDVIIKTQTLNKVGKIYSYTSNVYEAEIEAKRMDLIGEYQDSCNTIGSSRSAFGKLFENALGSFFECPGCFGKIASGQGITKCPHCGLTKEQAGSICV